MLKSQPQLSPRQLEALLAVVEHGTMIRASQALGISQPAVSRLIADLTESLGFALLERRNGRLVPTQEARFLMPDIKRSLDLLGRISDTGCNITQRKAGELRIALVEDLERWLRGERSLLWKHAKVAKAIDYLLSPGHWPAFNRFLDDGHVCLTSNAAERSLRGVALGRKAWLFAGSERGGQPAAFMYTLIASAISPPRHGLRMSSRVSLTSRHHACQNGFRGTGHNQTIYVQRLDSSLLIKFKSTTLCHVHRFTRS